MEGKKEYITCRLEPEVKNRFEEAARSERMYPAQKLRILIEDYLASRKAPKGRQLATSQK